MLRSLPLLAISFALLASCQIATKPPLTQPTDGKTFLSFRAPADHTPDADPASDFWKDIPPIIVDKSVIGPEMPAFRAEVRSRWTATNLYILFAGHYEKLTLNPAPNTQIETPHLWEKDCFELYIGNDFEHTNLYRELQMSPAGEFLDNNINSAVTRPGFNGEEKWNSNFKVHARIDDQNKIWYGEMQIPLPAITVPPDRLITPGTEFRINIYRQDSPLTPTSLPRELLRGNRAFLAWQPPKIWNPHHPEIFGTLRLVN